MTPVPCRKRRKNMHRSQISVNIQEKPTGMNPSYKSSSSEIREAQSEGHCRVDKKDMQ
jgi:hypothetical protein